MPFTHSYSSLGIAARDNQNRGPHNLGNGSTSSISNSLDINAADSPSTSDNDSSSRSRLFSSGRKSPDPFRRFRRLSSSNELNIATAPAALDDSQSFDSQQSYNAAYTDTRIPSTTSLGSGSKHSFSFAKLRRPGVKQSSPRSSAPNSSNEDRQQQQQQHFSASNGDAAAPGYLKPGPGSSASPFLNKHSATVGRASGSISAGHTAKNGLAQVFNGGSSSAATVGPASSVYSGTASNGVPPPKPPKPKPSLLTAFPRSGGSNRSLSGSISAPNTAPLETGPESLRRIATSQQGTLQPPASAGPGAGFYRNIAHSRSQEAVAEARLEAEALRASAGTPLPPPRRLNPSRAGGMSNYSQQSSTPMGRTVSGGSGGVVGALGQVGQLGAAMGRKGWDFMKTLQTNTAAGGGVLPARNDGAPGYRTGGHSSAAAIAAENEPTRQWLALLDAPDSTRRPSEGIFGAPLKDAVLRSRLSSLTSDPPTEDHLGVPDLGSEFSASFIHSPGATPRASVAGTTPTDPLSREQARCLYLPRIVVRCIESLEKWGPSEEGIYRISGRSSHTSKLRLHFSDPRNDLRLDEINPADLDINSVCSVLKSYLRELPEPLIPLAHSKMLDQAVARLLADTDGGTDAKSDARAANLTPEKVADELAPLMRRLPVHNWYLLRELSCHLGMLAQPEVVRSTKMPVSNLTLVLAPTVSISLPLLQVLVRHTEVVFAGPVPCEDAVGVSVSAAAAKVSSPAKETKRPSPPPRPVKPERLSPASKLPVLVRKRASSMGLGALLSSPTRSRASPAQSSPQPHRRTPSTTPSLELPDFISASASSPAADPYSRPSTSLGHFASSPPANRSTSGTRDDAFAPGDTPIARYYARTQSGVLTPTLSPHRMPASSPNLAHLTTSPMLSDSGFDEPRSGRTSALDRPRPPTSSSASFFAGRSRRTDSVSVLSASGSAASVDGEGGTSPLRITKRSTMLAREGGRSEEDVKGRVERYLQSGPGRA
uniref:Rho-GAP domain-containing protein n=1 Tax=Kalmanozyma brasiliensis (strain GHG001) TaxID=1365824 RepID=V5EXG8_KALBG